MQDEKTFVVPKPVARGSLVGRPRRSSILKKPLGDIQNVAESEDKTQEKRRVSFLDKVFVKEFQLEMKQKQLEMKSAYQETNTEGNEVEKDNRMSKEYMAPPNKSFHQTSTPVGAKPRPLSSDGVHRLSVIPNMMDKSFSTFDDDSDIQVFEESSEAMDANPPVSPKENNASCTNVSLADMSLTLEDSEIPTLCEGDAANVSSLVGGEKRVCGTPYKTCTVILDHTQSEAGLAANTGDTIGFCSRAIEPLNVMGSAAETTTASNAPVATSFTSSQPLHNPSQAHAEQEFCGQTYGDCSTSVTCVSKLQGYSVTVGNARVCNANHPNECASDNKQLHGTCSLPPNMELNNPSDQEFGGKTLYDCSMSITCASQLVDNPTFAASGRAHSPDRSEGCVNPSNTTHPPCSVQRNLKLHDHSEQELDRKTVYGGSMSITCVLPPGSTPTTACSERTCFSGQLEECPSQREEVQATYSVEPNLASFNHSEQESHGQTYNRSLSVVAVSQPDCASATSCSEKTHSSDDQEQCTSQSKEIHATYSVQPNLELYDHSQQESHVWPCNGSMSVPSVSQPSLIVPAVSQPDGVSATSCCGRVHSADHKEQCASQSKKLQSTTLVQPNLKLRDVPLFCAHSFTARSAPEDVADDIVNIEDECALSFHDLSSPKSSHSFCAEAVSFDQPSLRESLVDTQATIALSCSSNDSTMPLVYKECITIGTPEINEDVGTNSSTASPSLSVVQQDGHSCADSNDTIISPEPMVRMLSRAAIESSMVASFHHSIWKSAESPCNKRKRSDEVTVTERVKLRRKPILDKKMIKQLELFRDRMQEMYSVFVSRCCYDFYLDMDQIQAALKLYANKSRCCVGVLTCLIDFGQLDDTDLIEVDLTAAKEIAPIPNISDFDDSEVDKAKWTLEMLHYFNDVYASCQDVIEEAERHLSWSFVMWNPRQIQVSFNQTLLLTATLEQSNIREVTPGTLPCFKIGDMNWTHMKDSMETEHADVQKLFCESTRSLPKVIRSCLDLI